MPDFTYLPNCHLCQIFIYSICLPIFLALPDLPILPILSCFHFYCIFCIWSHLGLIFQSCFAVRKTFRTIYFKIRCLYFGLDFDKRKEIIAYFTFVVYFCELQRYFAGKNVMHSPTNRPLELFSAKNELFISANSILHLQFYFS